MYIYITDQITYLSLKILVFCKFSVLCGYCILLFVLLCKFGDIKIFQFDSNQNESMMDIFHCPSCFAFLPPYTPLKNQDFYFIVNTYIHDLYRQRKKVMCGKRIKKKSKRQINKEMGESKSREEAKPLVTSSVCDLYKV